MKKLLTTILILGIIGAGMFYFSAKEPTPIAVGADTVKTAGLGVYRMSGVGVSSSATSIGLTSLTLTQNDYPIQDSDLSSTFYMTLEPGDTDRQEFVSCTTVGTNTGSTVTLSGCTRGLSPIAPYTASSTLQFSHSGGSKVIFSNSPQLYNDAAFKGNDETITGTWLIGAPTADLQIATKKYADDLAIAGAPDATLTVKGLVEIATQIGMASTSAIGAGDTTAPLALTAAYSTSTPDGTSQAGLFAVVSENDGKLNQLWLDLTESFSFAIGNFSGLLTANGGLTSTGVNTLSATSTMATTTTTAFTALATSANPLTLNTVDYNMPSSDGSASQVLSTDGSGALTWVQSPYLQLTASDTLGASSDGAKSLEVTSYTKAKEITMRANGTIRVKFDLKTTSATRACYGRIYVNGVAVGTERTNSSTSYVNYSEDISIDAGDKVQVYIHLAADSGGLQAVVANYRFYYTKAIVDEYSVTY